MTAPEKKNRYVAYFDMLGYKTATLRNSAKAWETLRALQDRMDFVSKLIVSVPAGKVALKDRIKAFILADSVLMFTPEDTLFDLIAILTLTTELFSQNLHRCVLLRGAITHGEFFYNLDLNLFGGIPFVKAYELERKAQWSGIVVDDVVAEHYKKNPIPTNPDGSLILIPWEVPLKNGSSEKMWVLDWLGSRKNIFQVKPPISIQDYYAAFTPLFGPYNKLPKESQDKYTNTLVFVNHCLMK